MARRYRHSYQRDDPAAAIAIVLVIFAIFVIKYISEHLGQIIVLCIVVGVIYIIYSHLKRRHNDFDSTTEQSDTLDLASDSQEDLENRLDENNDSNLLLNKSISSNDSPLEKHQINPAPERAKLKVVEIYNESGALSDLLEKIGDPQITSLHDVFNFKNYYEANKKKILEECEAEVKSDINELQKKFQELKRGRVISSQTKSTELTNQINEIQNDLIQTGQKIGVIQRLLATVKTKRLTSQLINLKENFNSILEETCRKLDEQILYTEQKIKESVANLKTIVSERAIQKSRGLDRINDVINQNQYLIYGATGELKVISKLKTLPAGYHVINDYKKEFYKPIYDRREDDRIHSIQVDHIVVGPTGVFIIETKYWSKKSVESTDLFSPVKQIKRAALALFVILNEAIKIGEISSLISNWGARKISPKQIIASIGPVPHSEYQFVKVLNLDQLVPYIKGGKSDYSHEDVDSIVKFLIGTSQ